MEEKLRIEGKKKKKRKRKKKKKKKKKQKDKKEKEKEKEKKKTRMDLCDVWGVMRKRYWEQFYKTPRKQKLFSPIRHPISLK